MIAEVTIIDMKPEHLRDPSNSTGMAVMNVHVEDVIKGKIGEGSRTPTMKAALF